MIFLYLSAHIIFDEGNIRLIMGNKQSIIDNRRGGSSLTAGTIALTSCYNPSSPALSRIADKVSHDHPMSPGGDTPNVRRIAVVSKSTGSSLQKPLQAGSSPQQPLQTPVLTIITSGTSSVLSSHNNSYCSVDDAGRMAIDGDGGGGGSDSTAKTPALVIQRQRFVGSDGFHDSESPQSSVEVLHSSSPTCADGSVSVALAYSGATSDNSSSCYHSRSQSHSHSHSRCHSYSRSATPDSLAVASGTGVERRVRFQAAEWEAEQPFGDALAAEQSLSCLEESEAAEADPDAVVGFYHVVDPRVPSAVVPARQLGDGLALLELEAEAHVTPPIAAVIHSHTPFNSPRRLSSPLPPPYSASATSRMTLPLPLVPDHTHIVLQPQPGSQQQEEAPGAADDCMTPVASFDMWSVRAERYPSLDLAGDCADDYDDDCDSGGGRAGRARGLVLVDLEEEEEEPAQPTTGIGDGDISGFRRSSLQSPASKTLSILIPSLRAGPPQFPSSQNCTPRQQQPDMKDLEDRQRRRRRSAWSLLISALRRGAMNVMTTCQLSGCQQGASAASTPTSTPPESVVLKPETFEV